MDRCVSCNGLVTKTDTECYSCGERLPGQGGFANSLLRLFSKTKPKSAVNSRVIGTRDWKKPA